MIVGLKGYCQGGDRYFSAAQSKHTANDLSGAIIELSKAIENETSKTNLGLYYDFRGSIKFELEDYYGAVNDYTKAISYGFQDDNIFLERAKTKDILKNYQGAIEDYTKHLYIKNYEIVKSAMGYGSSGGFDTNQEEKNFNRVYATVFLLRGNAKFNLDNYVAAIQDYDIAIKIDPLYDLTFYNRGLAKLQLKQKEKGCLDFSKAGELGMEDAYNTIKKYCN